MSILCALLIPLMYRRLHFVYEIFNCQVCDHFTKRLRLLCKFSKSTTAEKLVYNLRSSAYSLHKHPLSNKSATSLTYKMNNNGPIELPWITPPVILMKTILRHQLWYTVICPLIDFLCTLINYQKLNKLDVYSTVCYDSHCQTLSQNQYRQQPLIV